MRLRLALVLLFAALPLLAARVAALRAGADRSFDARVLPERLGDLPFAGEEPLTPEVLNMLAPDSYAMRLYARERGPAVWLYVALYSGAGTSGAHDPAVCYPAQGWDAGEPVELEAVLPGGERLAVRVMDATQGGLEELVLYWFQPSERWPARTPREQLLRIADGLAGRPQYGFVRLSTRIQKPGAAARAEAEALLLTLAGEVAPWVRNSLAEKPPSPAL